MTQKPKIRYIHRPSFYGINCLPVYLCESYLAIGIGASAEGAYDDWLKDLPKTVMGRLIRRFLIKLFDA